MQGTQAKGDAGEGKGKVCVDCHRKATRQYQTERNETKAKRSGVEPTLALLLLLMLLLFPYSRCVCGAYRAHM